MADALDATKSCVSAALGFALGVSLLAVSPPARAGDDEVPLDIKIFRSLLEGFGLKSGDEAGIHYHERAPLVHAAQPHSAAAGEADAACQQSGLAERSGCDARQGQEDGSERSTTSRANARRRNSAAAGRAGARRQRPRAASRAIAANASIGSEGDRASVARRSSATRAACSAHVRPARTTITRAQFTGEPPRTSLTEPPPGYQTPSPDQPYGSGQGGGAKGGRQLCHPRRD